MNTDPRQLDATVRMNAESSVRIPYDRESVLRKSVDVFNKHGYKASSVGILAESLGISRSTIYHHVPSKESLLELALQRALGSLEAILEKPGAVHGTSLERLKYALRRIVHIAVEELPFVTLLLRLRGNTAAEAQGLERWIDFVARISEMVQGARSEGDLRNDVDPQRTSRLLLGTITSITEWYKPGGSLALGRDELADEALDLIFIGIQDGSAGGSTGTEEHGQVVERNKVVM